MKKIFIPLGLTLILILIGCNSLGSSKTPLPGAAITKVPFALPGASLTPTAPGSPSVAVLPTLNPESFTFVSLGTTQIEAANFTSTVNQIATIHPNLVIFNGKLEIGGPTNVEINPMIIDINNAGLSNQTIFIRSNNGNGSSGNLALWERYISTSPNGKNPPPGVSDYVSINSNSDYPNYSFLLGNSIIIGLDVPGASDLLTSDQLTFLDSRLTYAEGKGLVHAFIFFHLPLICIESTSCDCTTRPNASCTPSELVSVLNRHPIVSATFHGNEHILEWTHPDRNKSEALTTSNEGLLTPQAEGPSYQSPARTDYTYIDVGSSQGFATITVNGPSFSVNYYKVGASAPVWTRTFTKGAAVPTDPSGAGIRPLKYYVVDRVLNNTDFAELAAWGINTAVVDFNVNGKTSDWQAIFVEAAKYDINIVIWPSDWIDPRPDCDWEAPFPVSANGDITKVKPLLDVASQYSNFIGIVNGHEYFWTCKNMTFDEMAGLKDQLKAYALSKGRAIKVWNYTDSLFDESRLPANQISRIMDVAVIWKHCAGDTTDRCTGNNSTLTRIKNSRARLTQLGLGGKVELVFLVQTFTGDSPYNVKFTLPQLENFSCEVLNTSAVDGFGYYTWDAGWWPDLHNWPDLQPAILFAHDHCFHTDP